MFARQNRVSSESHAPIHVKLILIAGLAAGLANVGVGTTGLRIDNVAIWKGLTILLFLGLFILRIRGLYWLLSIVLAASFALEAWRGLDGLFNPGADFPTSVQIVRITLLLFTVGLMTAASLMLLYARDQRLVF
jgi:hypothetical protein